MPAKPKVFVTRLIPDVGSAIQDQCDAEVWPDPLPPPYALLREKIAGLRRPGVAADRPHRRRPARRGSAPEGRQQLRRRLQQHRRAGRHAARHRVGNTPGVLTDATADMAFCLLIAAARRLVEGHGTP